jgi:hypothetical protein
LVSETLASVPGPAPLPLWLTVRETYRLLWLNRWVHFWQLFVWAMLTWLMQIPAELLIGLLQSARLEWAVSGRDFLPYVLNLVILILCLLAGGGLMFLSIGRAIMFGRKPRIGDAVRPLRLGSFWRILGVYWLIVNLVPTVVVHSLRIQFEIAGTDDIWLTYYGLIAAYWLWAVAAAPAIVLALPIAAFEAPAAPIREGWSRLRGNRFRLSALCLLAAMPPLAVEMLNDYGVTQLVLFSEANNWPYLVQYLVTWPLAAPVRSMLSFLLILILAASVVSAYARLSPRFEHVARVFD